MKCFCPFVCFSALQKEWKLKYQNSCFSLVLIEYLYVYSVLTCFMMQKMYIMKRKTLFLDSKHVHPNINLSFNLFFCEKMCELMNYTVKIQQQGLPW